MEIGNRDHLKNLRANNEAELETLHRFIAVKQSIAEHWHYTRTVVNSEWQLISFSFSACSITISNDSNNEVSFSWDGNNLDGELLAKETLDLNSLERDKIYLKGNGQIRIWAF